MTGALNAKARRAVLQIAEWQEGVVEMPSNSNKVKYNTAYYGREVSGRAYPWCMTFVWWVFREAGFSLYKTASCTALVNRYRVYAPRQIVTSGFRPGDIVFFDFSGSRKKTEHVGIVAGVVGSTILTIEGPHQGSNHRLHRQRRQRRSCHEAPPERGADYRRRQAGVS